MPHTFSQLPSQLSHTSASPTTAITHANSNAHSGVSVGLLIWAAAFKNSLDHNTPNLKDKVAPGPDSIDARSIQVRLKPKWFRGFVTK